METNNIEKNVPWYREEVNKVLSKEEQKEIVDLAMTELRGVSFPSSLKNKDKLRQNLDEMFNVIGFAKHDYFTKNKITKVCGIDEKHKPFFDRILQRLKEIIPLSAENNVLPKAADGLRKLSEAYLCVLAYKNTELRNEYKNAKDSDYTLGTFPVRLLQILNERHKFIYHGDLFLLKDLMSQASDDRNLGAHNDLDESFEDVRLKIKLFFSYIVAVNFASLQIFNARNGGIRFYPAKNCSGNVQIVIKEEEILKKPWNINYSDKMIEQPVYQWNDLQGKYSNVDCHIVFTPSNGGTPEEYQVTFKEGGFVDVHLGGEKAVSPKEQTQPQKEDLEEDDEIIGVHSTFNFSSLKPVEKPCKGGTFTGTIDERQLPHGKGLFRRENNYTYDGMFDHGRPMGEFMVKNAKETWIYHGTLANDLTFAEGKLIHQDGKIERIYIGIFEGESCKKGKYYRNGELKYDGEFGIVDTSKGKILVFQGKGTLYYEDAKYVGEVDKNQPNGEGWKVYNDSSKPIECGWWEDGTLIASYPLADAPEKNKNTDDGKHQIEERLQSAIASDVINSSETSIDEEAIEEEVIDEVSFVEVTIVNQKKLDLTFWCEENALPIFGDKMYCIAGQTIRVKVKDGCTDCEKACMEEHFSLRVPTDVETCEWNLDEEYCQLSKSIREGELTDFDGKLPDGTTYKGKVDAWKRPQGNGLLKTESGSYEGEFVDGKLQGKGKWTAFNGVYKGTFKDGKLDGDVEKIDKFGKKTIVVWINGEFQDIKS